MMAFKGFPVCEFKSGAYTASLKWCFFVVFGMGNSFWEEAHGILPIHNKKTRTSRDRRSRCGARYVN